jgi:hypothetical protein
MDPFINPLHEIFVVFAVMAIIAGSRIVTFRVAEHPLASVAVNV